MNDKIYDVLIIGGGPSGLNVAIEVSKAGLDYVVLEKGVLVNSLYNFPANMTFFSTSRKLEVADTPFISHLEKPTRMEALEYYRRLMDRFNLDVRFYEPVETMERLEEQSVYKITSSKATYLARTVVVATGFYDTPRKLDVPGEDLPKVTHYYNDPHPYVGQEVLVIGARNSACDAALETYYKGAKVTMAIRGEGIHKNVKYWIRPHIENRIKEGSIKAYLNTTVKEIRPQEVVLDGPEGEFTIKNDFVLAMTGYQPNFKFFTELGIQIEEDETHKPCHHPQTLETNLPDVYMAGVACSGLATSKLFIENTRDHGEKIVQAIMSKRAAAV
ncbi:MAG: YpdA family putative bacillithiol disulfide reductase [Bacteroidota bacterium]